MSKIIIQGCGSGGAVEEKAEIFNYTNDFCIKVKGKTYRFDVDSNGNLTIPLINGVDVKITNYRCYPAITLIHK